MCFYYLINLRCSYSIEHALKCYKIHLVFYFAARNQYGPIVFFLNIFLLADDYVLQAFMVEKTSFKGDWEMATHDISMTVGETIGSGGMRQCFHATIRGFPPQYAVEAPHGWVAKFYRKEVPGESYNLCRKVWNFFAELKCRFSLRNWYWCHRQHRFVLF